MAKFRYMQLQTNVSMSCMVYLLRKPCRLFLMMTLGWYVRLVAHSISSVCPSKGASAHTVVSVHHSPVHLQFLTAGDSSPFSPGINGLMEASCCTCAALTAACSWAGNKGMHAELTGTSAGA